MPLALYDGAEVILKPAFGALADRIGPRPVLIGGLLAFAAASAGFVLAGQPETLGLARLGQGTAAAAFSPAAAALVAQLAPPTSRGRSFGTYGAWKGLGYTLGPVLGGALITLGGFVALFAALAALGVAVAVWARLAVPAVPPAPKTRETLLGLTRRLTQPSFLRPVLALAAATAALSVGVGFLPVRGAKLSPLATGTIVSLLALCAALVQPRAGRAHDTGRLPSRTGMAAGLLLAAAGFALAAAVSGPVTLGIAAVAIGVGAGLVTPLGFAALAAHAPPGRTGQTMGAAIANPLGLGAGLLGLTGLLTAAGCITNLPHSVGQSAK